MKNHTTAADKRIVGELDFDAKTAKRVTFEAFEFTIVGPYQVEVANASYGFKKDDHTYTVGIDNCGDVPLPVECECPADIHREPDCKHKLALATVGGLTVLHAAVEFETPATLSLSTAVDVTTAAEVLQPDGGATVTDDQQGTCPNGDGRCDGPDGPGLPCFDCFEVDK